MGTASNNQKYREYIFTTFKYIVYLFLIWNCVLFFREDWAASAYTFSSGFGIADIPEAFAATIDTIAWVILLLCFELATSLLPDETLKKNSVKWGLYALHALCYTTILFAFYGYLGKFIMFLGASSVAIKTPCMTLIDSANSLMNEMDDYSKITAENCKSLLNQDMFKVRGQSIYSTQEVLRSAQKLAFIDILNSGAWIGVVLILEAEVWLQLHGLYKAHIGKLIKFVLYSLLFLCAAYWGFMDGFLDFWDAFLWLVAFIFIELNFLQWTKE